jgi:pilus assembly protein CpaD
MCKSHSLSVSAMLRLGICLSTSMLLAGCLADAPGIDDAYVPQTHYERYPIKVAKAPVRLDVDSRKGGLQPMQINAISAFARSANGASISKVVISRPSAGGASHAGARQIYALLVDNGIPPERISQTTYRGSSKSPVTVAYTRAIAVTKECGDWSTDLNHTPSNDPYANFGCSVQHNIAQMVANPNDFETPAAATPVWADRRADINSGNGSSNAFRVYYYFN